MRAGLSLVGFGGKGIGWVGVGVSSKFTFFLFHFLPWLEMEMEWNGVKLLAELSTESR